MESARRIHTNRSRWTSTAIFTCSICSFMHCPPSYTLMQPLSMHAVHLHKAGKTVTPTCAKERNPRGTEGGERRKSRSKKAKNNGWFLQIMVHHVLC